MEEVYSSLKVTISRLGDKKYLSLLDSDLPTVGGGRGHQFIFDPDAPCAGVPRLPEFSSALATGRIPFSGFIESFGKCLFDCAFGGDNRAYETAAGLAQSLARRLRICMNVLTPDLVDVPWEYMHDGGGFVIKRGPAIVRLLEGVTTTESSFAPVQKLLLAVADPTKSPDFVSFGGEAHLEELERILGAIGGLEIRSLLHPSRKDIDDAFHGETFDAFYFIGHGAYLKNGGGHLVCELDGEPDLLRADDLAAWIRESSSLRFVYLNSCSTAVTSAANPMQGVAQRLMRDGRVSAVAAMQADVNQKAAQQIAEKFFKLLSKGRSPEDAMQQSRTSAADPHSFGVPVLYSTYDAPARFKQNRLAAFLSMTDDSRCALLLPDWIMGLPGKAGKEANRKGLKGGQPYYRGPTFATADINAAWAIADLVRVVLTPDNVQILSNEHVSSVAASHRFVFGSQSSGILAGVLELFESEFEFDYDPADAPGHWVIRDKDTGNCYEIQKPNDLDSDDFLGTTDYGVIQKFTETASKRVYFMIAGLGSRATEGCGYYLRDHWAELLHEFGGEDFGIVVTFPQHLGPQDGKRQDRAEGKRPCSEIAQRIAKHQKPGTGNSDADATGSTRARSKGAGKRRTRAKS